MSRAAVAVRTAGPADAECLASLACTARDASGERRVPVGEVSRLEAALSRPDVQVLVAEAGAGRDDGEPLGVLVLRRGELLPLSGEDAAHVEQLWVHPDHRRRGVARALLRAATAHAQQSGLDEVTCAVPPADRDAQRFLARLGFAPLVSRRVVSVSVLRRRLGAEPRTGRRAGLEQLLATRRREHRHLLGGPRTG